MGVHPGRNPGRAEPGRARPPEVLGLVLEKSSLLQIGGMAGAPHYARKGVIKGAYPGRWQLKQLLKPQAKCKRSCLSLLSLTWNKKRHKVPTIMPPPSASLSSSLSSRKRGNNSTSLCAPRIFLFVIVIIAFGLFALSIYLTSRLDRWLPNTDVISTAFRNDDTIRPVICNELLKDASILDPSKSRAAFDLIFLH